MPVGRAEVSDTEAIEEVCLSGEKSFDTIVEAL